MRDQLFEDAKCFAMSSIAASSPARRDEFLRLLAEAVKGAPIPLDCDVAVGIPAKIERACAPRHAWLGSTRRVENFRPFCHRDGPSKLSTN
jgi:hypothetical protein